MARTPAETMAFRTDGRESSLSRRDDGADPSRSPAAAAVARPRRRRQCRCRRRRAVRANVRGRRHRRRAARSRRIADGEPAPGLLWLLPALGGRRAGAHPRAQPGVRGLRGVPPEPLHGRPAPRRLALAGGRRRPPACPWCGARRLRRHRLHGRDRRRDRDAAARDHLGDAVARRVRREGRRLPARARPAAGPGVRIGCGAPQARCRSAHLSRRRAGPRGAGGADPARRCPPARRRGAAHRPARLHRPDRLRARDRASGHTGPLLRGRRRHGPCRGRRGAQVHRRRRAVGVPGRAGVGRRGRRARHSRRMGHRSPRCSP